MPRQEFIALVQKIKKDGKGIKMSKRDLIWKFSHYKKRTSGNVWRINDFLKKEKMVVIPNYQTGWVDENIELKEKDKVKITNDDNADFIEDFDPVTRLSILEAASKTPTSVKREAKLTKAHHLMWKNDYSQLPVMNNERQVLGIINWQTIAKGLILGNKSDCVKDYMTNEFKVLDEDTSLFEAIKEVIKTGIVFVSSKNNKIKGPVTPSDLNEEFIEQIEPFILLEQIENFIRLILHDKIIMEDMLKLIEHESSTKEINSLSDLTFGQYIRIIENNDTWTLLKLPFDKVDFVKDLHQIREIRNSVMHFHPDKLLKTDLSLLRRISKFLKDYIKRIH